MDEQEAKKEFEKFFKESEFDAQKNSIEDLIESFPEYLRRVNSDLKDLFDIIEKKYGGIKSFIKTTWQLEEKTVEQFSFEDVLLWVKPRMNKQLYSGACVYKIESHKKKMNKNDVHICFLNLNSEPLLDGSAEHLLVHAESLDSMLVKYFGREPMIVLR